MVRLFAKTDVQLKFSRARQRHLPWFLSSLVAYVYSAVDARGVRFATRHNTIAHGLCECVWKSLFLPPGNFCKMQLAKCKMQNAKCKMQNAKCKMQNARCKMQDAKCGCKMQNANCKMKLQLRAHMYKLLLRILAEICKSRVSLKFILFEEMDSTPKFASCSSCTDAAFCTLGQHWQEIWEIAKFLTCTPTIF